MAERVERTKEERETIQSQMADHSMITIVRRSEPAVLLSSPDCIAPWSVRLTSKLRLVEILEFLTAECF